MKGKKYMDNNFEMTEVYGTTLFLEGRHNQRIMKMICKEN